MSLLELKGVRKSFGTIEALRGVTFSVDAGSAVALVGDNGAGKSTLMKTITGVHRPDTGEIRFDGVSIVGKDPGRIREAGIEMIYQDLALARMRDVASNIFLGRELTRSVLGVRFIDTNRMRNEAEAMVARLGARIPSVSQMTGQLSGGQQQSVAIARALTFNPKLVIMDEPTAALGVVQTRQVLDLMKRLRDRGLAVMMISHNLTDVFEVADRIAVLYLGRMVIQDKASAFDRQSVVEYMTNGSLSRNAAKAAN
jgi:ABC-type sugar transport system ATPase subunit